MGPRRPVDALVLSVDLTDLLRQPRVSERPVRWRAALPVPKPRAVHARHPTHQRDREVGPLRRDERQRLAYASSVPWRRRPRLLLGSRAPYATSGSHDAGAPAPRAHPSRARPLLALAALGLLDPVAQRHIRDPEILREPVLRLARDANELDGLTTKLRWIRRSGRRHFSPAATVFRRKRSGVLETGATPLQRVR
jgi:hypothetical protein